MELKSHKDVRYGRAYLTGPWWAELRQRYAEHPEAPHACAVCGTPRYQLHHRTYERLGAEHISDLIALCDAHHEALHRAYRHHHERHPADSLAAFSDAWVLIRRRPYARAHAPLPELTLYGGRGQGRGHADGADLAVRRGGPAGDLEALR